MNSSNSIKQNSIVADTLGISPKSSFSNSSTPVSTSTSVSTPSNSSNINTISYSSSSASDPAKNNNNSGGSNYTNNPTSAPAVTSGVRLNKYHPTLNTGMSDIRIQNAILENPLVRALIIPECDINARRRCMSLLSRILVAATPVLHAMAAFSHRSQELHQEPTAITKLLVEQYNQIISLIAKTNPSNSLVLFWLAHHLQNLEKEISILCPNLPLLPKPIIRPASESSYSSSTAADLFNNSNNSDNTDALLNSTTNLFDTPSSGNKKSSKRESSPVETKTAPPTPPLCTTPTSALDVSSILAPLPTHQLYTRIHEAKCIVQDLADRVQGAVCMVFWESWDAVYELVAEIVGYEVVVCVEKGRIFRPSGSAAMYISSKKKIARDLEGSKIRSMKAHELQAKNQTEGEVNENTKDLVSLNAQFIASLLPNEQGQDSPTNTNSPILSPPDHTYSELLQKEKLKIHNNIYPRKRLSSLSKEHNNNAFGEEIKIDASSHAKTNSSQNNTITDLEPTKDSKSNSTPTSIKTNKKSFDERHNWSSRASTTPDVISKTPTSSATGFVNKNNKPHEEEDLTSVSSEKNKNGQSSNPNNQNSNFNNFKTSLNEKQKDSTPGFNKEKKNPMSFMTGIDLSFIKNDSIFDQELFMQHELFGGDSSLHGIQNFSGLSEMPDVSNMNLDNLNIGINMGINMGMASLGMNLNGSNEKLGKPKSLSSGPRFGSSSLSLPHVKTHAKSFDAGSMKNQKPSSSKIPNIPSASRANASNEFDFFGMGADGLSPHTIENVNSKSRSNSICIGEVKSGGNQYFNQHVNNVKEMGSQDNGNKISQNESRSSPLSGKSAIPPKRSFSSMAEPKINKATQSNNGQLPNEKNNVNGDEFSFLRKRIRLLEEMEDQENSQRRARQQHIHVQQQMQQLRNLQLQFRQQPQQGWSNPTKTKQNQASTTPPSFSNSYVNSSPNDHQNKANNDDAAMVNKTQKLGGHGPHQHPNLALHTQHKHPMSAADKAIWAQLHGSELQTGSTMKVPMSMNSEKH